MAWQRQANDDMMIKRKQLRVLKCIALFLAILLLCSSLTFAEDFTEFPADKRGHFFVGFAIGMVGTMYGKDKIDAVKKGIGWSTLAGFIKEVVDAQTGGKVEVMDFLSTVAGGAIATYIFFPKVEAKERLLEREPRHLMIKQVALKTKRDEAGKMVAIFLMTLIF